MWFLSNIIYRFQKNGSTQIETSHLKQGAIRCYHLFLVKHLEKIVKKKILVGDCVIDYGYRSYKVFHA